MKSIFDQNKEISLPLFIILDRKKWSNKPPYAAVPLTINLYRFNYKMLYVECEFVIPIQNFLRNLLRATLVVERSWYLFCKKTIISLSKNLLKTPLKLLGDFFIEIIELIFSILKSELFERSKN